MIAPNSSLLLLVSALFCLPLTAQQKSIPIPADALSAVGQVYYISETTDGYLGLSSDLGISFFDGALSKTLLSAGGASFDQPPQSPFFEDIEGSLWFTTYNALFKFNRKTGDVREFQLEKNGQKVTKHYRAFHLNIEKGRLLLRAGESIWSFDINEENYSPVASHVNSVSLAINPAENLIIGATWNSDTVQVFSLNNNEQYSGRSYATGNGQALMVSFAQSDTIAYLGTKSGLVELEVGTNHIKSRLVEATNTITTLSLSQDSSCIWFTPRRQGISCYSPKERRITQHLENSDSPGGREISALFQSSTGALWVAYANGTINYLVNPINKFTTHFKTSDTRIADAISTGDEFILGLSSGKMVSTTSIETPYFSEIPHKGEANGRLFYGEETLFQLGYHSLHVREDRKWRKLVRPESMVKEFFPGGGGRPISLNRFGVEEFTILADTLVVRPAVGFPAVDDLDFVKILALSDTTFLLSYQTKELWNCELTSAGYEVMGKYPLEGPVLSAVKTPKDSIYVGTPTGLFLLRGDRFVPCIPPSSISGQVISVNSLTYDEAGNIWCGTPRGLICYRPEMHRYNYFDEVDGLISSNFLKIRALHPKPGEIWMVTDSGLVSFQPKELLDLTQIATPYIAGIWVNDLPLDNQQVLQEPAPLSEPLSRNSLSFKLATVAPTRSAFSAIEFQLKDYDLNPISVSPNSTIRYKLPPGNYTLELTAINRNGLPSGKKTLPITIRPPFTQTLPFYVLCTCGLALTAIGIYILGLRRERLKQRRLQEQQARLAAERDRIAGEVHDDLGGQISSILYLSEEMLLAGEMPEYEHELSRINQLSRNSLQNVRDIIFALDNRKATLSALGDQLRGAGEVFFDDHKISFRASDSYQHPEFELTSRQKRNLTLIVKEAWHNIVKHAKATTVVLDVQEVNRQLVITTTDNGVGFSTTKSANGVGGYGLDNMRDKAAVIGGQLVIDSTPGQGTSLRLIWPLPTNDK